MRDQPLNQRGFGKGSFILAGDTFLILTERGEVVTAEASSSAYRELERAKVLFNRCWVSPALVNGLAYLRDNEGTLVCLDLRQ